MKKLILAMVVGLGLVGCENSDSFTKEESLFLMQNQPTAQGPQGEQGEQGESGRDGLNAECCDLECPEPIATCDAPLVLDENDTNVHVIAYFNREDLDGFVMQHYIMTDFVPILVSSHDVIEGGDGKFVSGDCNGTTLVKGQFELDHNETVQHALAIQFEQTPIVDDNETIEPPIEVPDENETIESII